MRAAFVFLMSMVNSFDSKYKTSRGAQYWACSKKETIFYTDLLDVFMNSAQTKVYIADLECLKDTALFERFLRLVPEYRREKALRFRFQKDQMQSLAVGLLLKKACADFGIPGADEHVSLGENGKPYLINSPDVQFNLSHSEGRAMCIMSRGADALVGCDVEKIKGDRGELAERFFMPEEAAWIKSFPDEPRRNEAFYRLWTLKECYMKVTGRGLSLSPGDFSFILDGMGVTLVHNGVCKEYSFWEYDFNDGYKYACCAKNLSEKVSLEKVLLNSL